VCMVVQIKILIMKILLGPKRTCRMALCIYSNLGPAEQAQTKLNAPLFLYVTVIELSCVCKMIRIRTLIKLNYCL
jgi:hypothetical protein